jgi:uncharacterized protein involved in response to NO
MNVALSRRRDYAGPALFSYGFRPFFFAAGVWAAFGILLWMPQYYGNVALPTFDGALTDNALLVDLAAVAWVAAFAGFVVAYGPLLVMRRPAWEEGAATR